MPTGTDLIDSSARRALSLQRPDGSFPPGHNGPWNNADTPARVTAHWLVLLAAAHQRSGNSAYRAAALRAADFLAQPARRPGGHGFRCFECTCPWLATNGLIGQAWVLEGLLEAGLTFDPAYLQPARDAIRAASFDHDLGLWRVSSLDGAAGSPHHTLNHQLWFSVMVYRLARALGQPDLEVSPLRHFDRLPELIHVEGRYLHMLVAPRHRPPEPPLRSRIPLLGPLRRAVENVREGRRATEQSVGYLSFTLLGAALLHREAPDLPLWRDERWLAAVRSSVAFADERIFSLPEGNNRYAFSYNPTGLEMAVVKQQLEGLLPPGGRSPAEWVREQLRRHYDPSTGLLNHNSDDPNILVARAYELCALRDLACAVS
jgi:hypothetical protein